MSAPRQGIAILCDQAGDVRRWLRDDLTLSHGVPVGQSWRQLLEPGSLGKAEALLTAARETGAALDWQLFIVIEGMPKAMRFAAAFADGQYTLLGMAEAATAASRRRIAETAAHTDLARLNNDLVQAQRTLAQKNVELERTNANLLQIRARLEDSQAQLLAANQRLLAQSNRDGLTGVPNRRALQGRLTEEVERADRYGHPFSLAIVDVDHFQQYNETLGHLAGDDALRTVASTLQSTARGCDFLARFGGAAFAMILPNIVGGPAAQACERLRRAITEIDQLPQPMTISLGLATYSPLTPTLDALIHRADQALFSAKQTGRNRVVTDWQQHCL